MTAPGRTAYEARFAHARPGYYVPWDSLSAKEKAVWERTEAASVAGHLAAIGTELEETRREAAEWAHATDLQVSENARLQADLTAAESEASQLRERVGKLEEALKPFSDVCDAEHMRWVKDEQVLELSTRAEVPVSEKLRGNHFRAARRVLDQNKGGEDV